MTSSTATLPIMWHKTMAAQRLMFGNATIVKRSELLKYEGLWHDSANPSTNTYPVKIYSDSKSGDWPTYDKFVAGLDKVQTAIGSNTFPTITPVGNLYCYPTHGEPFVLGPVYVDLTATILWTGELLQTVITDRVRVSNEFESYICGLAAKLK